MKWIWFALFILYAASAHCQQSVPQMPLVKNGNMEQKGAQGWFFGYSGAQNANPNGYSFQHSVEASASGEYSLRISCPIIKNDSVFCNLNQSFSAAGIPTGAKVTLKAKIKTVNIQGQGIALYLRGEKVADGKTTSIFYLTTEGKIPIVGTREFEEFSLTLAPYPGGADKITVLAVYLPATIGTFYLDDVSVTVN